MPEGDVLLYGAGSRYLIDLEEICRRCGLEVARYVANVPGEVFASDPSRVIERSALTPADRALPTYVPLVTPGYRQRAVKELDAEHMEHRPVLVDPNAVVAHSARLGQGVTINAGVIIGGAVGIGDYVLLNRAASIGHHSVLDRFVTVGPGVVIAGSVTIERGVFIGAGAVVLPKVRIGANATVGGGAVVTRDVASNTVVVGNPARVIRREVAGYGDAEVV